MRHFPSSQVSLLHSTDNRMVSFLRQVTLSLFFRKEMTEADFSLFTC